MLITIIFLLETSLLKFDLYRIESMLHFSSLECLQNIFNEQMVLYFGRHSAKMFICGKPIDRLISQYRPKIQAKKWYWLLFVNCIKMLTVAVWKLHVTLRAFPRLDFLEFIQSVVRGLLKTTSSSSSGLNPLMPRIM